MKADLTLPVLQILPDGSYLSVLVSPGVKGKARQALIETARTGGELDEDKAALVRVVEYEVPDRDGDGTGELIALITTIIGPRAAPAPLMAGAYHQRWEHETGNDPDQYQHAPAAIKADITRTCHLNPQRRHRTCPRVVKRARHNSYRVKRASDRGVRHSRPPTIRLANLGSLTLAA